MELKIDKEFHNLIPPLKDDELEQLEQNLINEGWRKNEAIIVWNGVIIDGHNRYNLCNKHKIEFKTIEKNFKNRDEVIVWIINNQLGRRNLMPYDRIILYSKKEAILKPLAKENLSKGGKGLPILAKVNIREDISKLAKVSHGTYDKAKFIESKATKETKEKLSKGEETINKVYTELKKKEQRENIVKEFKNAPQLINGKKKYSIILADPPWHFWGGGWKNQTQHYKTMSMDEIKNLPVKDLADENCILFMWVTFPVLKDVFEIMEAWGFEYSTCGFNWVKKTKEGKWHFGLGYWTRANSELCLIATKGKPVRQSASVSQIIDTIVEEHSKKPDIVRDKIVKLMGDLPRIELFARKKVEGWDVWGNEIKKEVQNDK
jgi:site-specific DNA-methyltransferase (adenine-specific)